MSGVSNGCRHLSFVPSSYSKDLVIQLATSNRAEKLRTLLTLPYELTIPSFDFSIHLPCLRVLDLRYVNVTKKMLNSISRLKQLRYLHLKLPYSVRSLPDSLSKLRNLQTLRLTESFGLEELPRTMRRMSSLRHLQIAECKYLNYMPAKMGELKYLQTLSVFIFGKQSGCNIRELQELKLGGELKIGNYGGQRFPDWMGSIANLKKVPLRNCRGCVQLPPLGQLPLLKSLHIEGMEALKCIGGHFYGDRAFPLLEDLTFADMPNLEEWSSESDHLQLLPRLEKLRICRCPQLTAISSFPSLSLLTIQYFEGESLPADLFQNQNHLHKLCIEDCSKLQSLPREVGNHAALQELWIERCNSLTSLRLQGCFPSLQNLKISSCSNPVSMVGDRHLTSLETLKIESCPELGPEGMEHLTSLKSLSIHECDKATYLPEGLKHASILQRLEIDHLRRFAVLPEWIGNLSSLHNLLVWHCDNLVSLPSGLQHLTNLKSLTISDCPELEKRCKRETGEDWHKIAHIASIRIKSQLS